MAVEADPGVGEVVRSRRVTSVFQPLVHLASRQVAGYECLSRGPAGSPLESPLALFEAAGPAGLTGELDWVCRAAGLARVLASAPHPSLTWFVNAEPSQLTAPCPADLRPVLARAEGHLSVVVEMTERAVDFDPAALLAAAQRARANGWGVALDDVGAAPRSLALLPFLQPDVVKLDMTLVQGRNQAEVATISNAVRAYAESTGAVVLAEGIEDERMLATALALGATYGQGWYFGRPGTLPDQLPGTERPFPLAQRVDTDAGMTPFEIGAAARRPGTADKALLLPNSLHLERQALSGGEALVLLATFQEGRHLTTATCARYEQLAARNVFTAALATGVAGRTTPGVRVVDLPPGDPLAAEWDVVVVGPHFAGALLARDRGDDGPDRERRFDYVITHDRALVLRAARSMLRWVNGAT
ncbi:MAG TPA: EAL domain-containing protein [Acidimicrobiales bacterium]|nr:EAL domain-containing protein [Acidimicrobiales bacterium]